MVFLCGDDTEKHALPKAWRKTKEIQGEKEEEEDENTRAIQNGELFCSGNAHNDNDDDYDDDDDDGGWCAKRARERKRIYRRTKQMNNFSLFLLRFTCEEKSEKGVYRRCYLAYWTISVTQLVQRT